MSVELQLAGLCGSDLHVYRGHDVATKVYVSDLIKKAGRSSTTVTRFGRHTSGHEFVGEVIALGSNFFSVSEEKVAPTGRPVLYSTLKAGDKVVSPFTVSCGECRYDNLSPSRL